MEIDGEINGEIDREGGRQRRSRERRETEPSADGWVYDQIEKLAMGLLGDALNPKPSYYPEAHYTTPQALP